MLNQTASQGSEQGIRIKSQGSRKKNKERRQLQGPLQSGLVELKPPGRGRAHGVEAGVWKRSRVVEMTSGLSAVSMSW